MQLHITKVHRTAPCACNAALAQRKASLRRSFRRIHAVSWRRNAFISAFWSPNEAQPRKESFGDAPAMQTSAAAAVDEAREAYQMSVDELKIILQDTLWGTERGLSVDSDTRAEISELISQLEARNPTPAPNEALEKLSGTWKLAYTSNSELVALLALSRLPLVDVGDILQIVNATAMTVENRVKLTAPFSRTSLSATALFDVRSPKLLQVEFQEGQVAMPELLADFEFPDNIDLMGQYVDLNPVKSVLKPLEGPLKTAVTTVGGLLSNAPDLKFPIRSPAPSSTWLLNTYLDDDLRVSRGDGGSVFVLVKEVLAALPESIADQSDWVSAVEPDAVWESESPENGNVVA